MTHQRLVLLITALFVTACERAAPPTVTTASPSTASAPLFGIGGGESDAHTHVSFVAPKALVRASARVVVDRTAPTGLNFFALQVNFKNGTWAHGGLQDVTGPNGSRKRQVNWGGLVNRGGGSGDYKNEDDRPDLEKIENPPTAQHSGPYDWKNGVEYEYVVERGAQVTLPPGDYRLLPSKSPVHIDHARAMWEWRFTVRPVTEAGAPFVAMLYDSADSFTSFYVWNESGGGGATAGAQHTSWWTPLYRVLGEPSSDQAPASWKRF